MYQRLQIVTDFIGFYFVSLIKQRSYFKRLKKDWEIILTDKSEDKSYFQEIVSLRSQLIKNHSKIDLLDFGAGSKKNTNTHQYRSISEIARFSAKPLRFGKLFYRIIKYFNYQYILDLGTSVGITTSFLGFANPNSQIVTFEGCPSVSEIAKENFQKLNLLNINVIVGNIDNTLQEQVSCMDRLDFVFFDANHTYDATIRYFEICLSKKHEKSCFIFDDIYWSDGMKTAWTVIKNNPAVSISIDLFWIGIVLFSNEKSKQHYCFNF